MGVGDEGYNEGYYEEGYEEGYYEEGYEEGYNEGYYEEGHEAQAGVPQQEVHNIYCLSSLHN